MTFITNFITETFSQTFVSTERKDILKYYTELLKKMLYYFLALTAGTSITIINE